MPNKKLPSFHLSALTLLCCANRGKMRVAPQRKLWEILQLHISQLSDTRSPDNMMDVFQWAKKIKHSPVKFPNHCCRSLCVIGFWDCHCPGVRVGSQWEAHRLTLPQAGHNHLYAWYEAACCQLTGRRGKKGNALWFLRQQTSFQLLKPIFLLSL